MKEHKFFSLSDELWKSVKLCCQLALFFTFAEGFKAPRYDAEEFEIRVSTSPHFVMFYAPWCGHCKRLQPLWDKFAEHYSSPGSEVTIAKVDCTQDTPICAKEDIKSYPTLKLFHNGNKSNYRGNRNLDDFVKYVKREMTTGGIPDQEKEEQPYKETDVSLQSTEYAKELSDQTFTGHVAEGLHFVKFYAPWCPHCQSLSPIWDELAKAYADSAYITIVKVDCTKHRTLCEDQSVTAYPMLFVYHQGMKVDEYSGARNIPNLMDFVEKAIKRFYPDSETGAEETKGKADNEFNDVTIQLTKENFDVAIQSGRTFVDFYAPWCIHCQKLAPIWEQLAVKMLVDAGGFVNIAKVDCTVEDEICRQEGITSYPTLIMFTSSTEKEEYKGPRTLGALFDFARGNPRDEL